MPAPRPPKTPEMQDLHRRLDAAHGALLRVHKAALDHERARYERVHPPVGGPLEFLKLALNDPWFAWLRPVSELIVQIDEFVMSKEPTELRQGEALLAQARQLLTPSETGASFAREYHRAISESPEVAIAHGELRRVVS